MAPLGPEPEMVSKERSRKCSRWDRKLVSLSAAAISVIPPRGAAWSSQARKLVTAAPSRRWAALEPSSSTAFLQALGSSQGSAPSMILAPAWRRRSKNQAAALLGSIRTAVPPRSPSASANASGGRRVTAGSSCALVASVSLRSSTNHWIDPVPSFACRIRKDSGRGVRGTSEPRTFRSQAMESG